MSKLERQVEALLAQMTLDEKVALLAGRDVFSTRSLARLRVPSVVMTDGPHGVRIHHEPPPGKPRVTTAFPTGTSFAASWNPDLVRRVGVALAAETRAMGWDVLLGPCINIIRHPLGGRSFEGFSEDPYLTGRLAVAYVRGMQSGGVGASVKHFACNNQEHERFRGNSVVDERTLREIYLPAFEAAVKEAQPWTVMCAYNRINGDYAAQNRRLLTDILKNEWGFDGIVVSDWGAVHATLESIRNGLDLEMPGPGKWFAPGLLTDAVNNWQVDEACVNDAARRLLRLALRCRQKKAAGKINTPGHQRLARQLAAEAITLLKNHNTVLPLDARRLEKVAVIGPNAAETAYNGGGSSTVRPPHTVHLLEALRRALGRKVAYAEGCDNHTEMPELQGLKLKAEYFPNPHWTGQPKIARTEDRAAFWWGGPTPLGTELFSVRWTGQFRVPRTGRYRVQVFHPGVCRLVVDGQTVLADQRPAPDASVDVAGVLHLEAGRDYALRLECARHLPSHTSHVKLMLGYAPLPADDDRIEQAVQAARTADVAIVAVGGMPFVYETEGRDRPNLVLPGRQNELVAAVAQANPNTIVVVNCGAPVEMPWADQVAGIVMAWYPGLEGGNALADILLGKVNPSGKLPMTFPKRLADTPAFNNYPGDREVRYGEGIFVGYRHYDYRQVEPLFPFGHGLSYTTFEYGELQVPKFLSAEGTTTVTVTVKNTGLRAGSEVVQLYVGDRQASVARPVRELKGFAKVHLRPGEERTVTFGLDDRSFAFYDVKRKQWTVEPGEFEIAVGSSSRDIQLRAVIQR